MSTSMSFCDSSSVSPCLLRAAQGYAPLCHYERKLVLTFVYDLLVFHCLHHHLSNNHLLFLVLAQTSKLAKFLSHCSKVIYYLLKNTPIHYYVLFL